MVRARSPSPDVSLLVRIVCRWGTRSGPSPVDSFYARPSVRSFTFARPLTGRSWLSRCCHVSAPSAFPACTVRDGLESRPEGRQSYFDGSRFRAPARWPPARGDPRAFDAVHDAFNGRLYNFLARLSNRSDAAEDLLEETWLRLVKHARRLRPDTRLVSRHPVCSRVPGTGSPGSPCASHRRPARARKNRACSGTSCTGVPSRPLTRAFACKVRSGRGCDGGGGGD